MFTDSKELNYADFLTAVEDNVREKMGEGYEVLVRRVRKNNAVDLDSISIREECESVAPNIYLNEMYRDYRTGMTVESIADAVISIYEENRGAFEGSDVQDFFDFEKIKDTIAFRLVNYERNRDMMENVPHVCYSDLCVEFVCILENRNGYGSVRITNDQMKDWGIDIGDLISYARVNTPRLLPPVVRSMQDMLCEMLTKKLELCDESSEAEEEIRNLIEMLKREESIGVLPGMYVLTTEQGIGGASCLIYDGLLERIRDMFDEDYYILPSSINEVILVPDSRADAEGLALLIPEVNREQVPLQEVLSDTLYHYPEFRIAI